MPAKPAISFIDPPVPPFQPSYPAAPPTVPPYHPAPLVTPAPSVSPAPYVTPVPLVSPAPVTYNVPHGPLVLNPKFVNLHQSELTVTTTATPDRNTALMQRQSAVALQKSARQHPSGRKSKSLKVNPARENTLIPTRAKDDDRQRSAVSPNKSAALLNLMKIAGDDWDNSNAASDKQETFRSGHNFKERHHKYDFHIFMLVNILLLE